MELKVIFLIFIVCFSGETILNAKGSRLTPGKQTWGYVEVRPGAFMFWWLYYTTGTVDYTKKPLVIWLQGGPGASGTGYGNFEEIGPLDTELNNRTYNWVNYTNVLFIDNPVGSGFSYVNDTKLLVKNNSQITSDLLAFTTKFMDKVPEFKTVPLYIFSESYGGKMAAQFAVKLQKSIVKGKINCNLKSVNLGDSWISPVDSVLTWGPYLYSTSLIDNSELNAINESAFHVKAALEQKKYVDATDLWDKTEEIISKYTNGVNVYNILETDTDPSSKSSSHKKKSLAAKILKKYHSDPLSKLMNGKIKKMLRVIPENVTWGGQSDKVFDALKEDFMKPVVRYVESLLNNTPIAVNVYNGQLDMIVDTMGTVSWAENMKWAGTSSWKKAIRKPIIIDNSTEMFTKSFKNFAFYWILKAGHMVPMDAPKTSVEMLKMMTNLQK